MQGRAINFDSGATLRRPRLADRQTDVFVGTEFNGQWLIVSYDSANKKKHHKSIIHCVRSDVLFKTTNVGAPNNTDFAYRRRQGGKGAMPPKLFRKYCHFVL